MNKIKRIIALVMASMCVCVLAACNDSAGTENNGGIDATNVKMYVNYNDTVIMLGAKADGIIEALGEPQSKTEIGDCGGLGAQVKYTYPSIDIYVLESKTDGNIIDQITFRDDTVTTPEGAYIGASSSEAKAVLGAPSSASDKALLYNKGNYTLKLSLENDIVCEINYITKSN